MHMIAKLISFLSGGQTDFLIPLSHQWHGVNVAPALDLVAFGAALITVGLLVNCIWCALRRRPFGIAFILMLATATAAYAASSTLGNLSSGSAISATDLFYDVQSVGTGGVKVTGTQLQTWAGTVVQTGPGATGGTCNPGATCTIQTALNPVIITSGNYTSSYYGELVNYNSASDQSPTLPQASAAGNGTFLVTCSIQHSQTVTPFSGDTIGGASTKSLPTGTQASPSCLTLTSDGISNWNPVPYSGSGIQNAGSATGAISATGQFQQANGAQSMSPMYGVCATTNCGYYFAATIAGGTAAGSAYTQGGDFYLTPIWIGQPLTIEAIAMRIGTGCAGGPPCTVAWGVAIYANVGNAPSGAPLASAFSTSNSTGGVDVSLSSNLSITVPGWYWLGYMPGDSTQRVFNGSINGSYQWSPGLFMGSTTSQGAMPNSAATEGYNATGGSVGVSFPTITGTSTLTASNSGEPMFAIKLYSVP